MNLLKKLTGPFTCMVCLTLLTPACRDTSKREPIDYVNPLIGNVSLLLVPTYPTIHLPNQMLRVYPERADYTSDLLAGLPVVVTSHRGNSAFNISPICDVTDSLVPVMHYTYDNEHITPYYYEVYLDNVGIDVHYAPAAQAGIYEFKFENPENPGIIINTRNGTLDLSNDGIGGWQWIDGKTRIYFYAESTLPPTRAGAVTDGRIDSNQTFVNGCNKALALTFSDTKSVIIRYGISFISIEQAKRNLKRDIGDAGVEEVAAAGRNCWNKALSKIQIRGGSDDEKTVFYTSLYRTYERMISLSEDGRYYSAFDSQIHDDEGVPFYTDDWVWDTYRATHPLRVLIESEVEQDIIRSYIRMAEQSPEGWMPTFPEVTGDSHRMNGNHAVAIIWDAWCKGLHNFDLQTAYNACFKAITEKTLLPWQKAPLSELDIFYNDHGYFPALNLDEIEYCQAVHSFERRQAIAIMLGNAYDNWCLAQMANTLGYKSNYTVCMRRAYTYRNVYNSATGFFHPRNAAGDFIEPFDYRFSGGQGARDYYGENNGWIYRWDVQHNPADLMALMGGREQFIRNLDQTFQTPLGKSKYRFYAQLPDHTGNVGQFSMANEPCLHIPYLYNYAGQPWMTQKRIRTLLTQWFRNDLMGMPGDEDGGGMSAFVVFSMLGFYPVTPGSPTYNIGSPVFEEAELQLANGYTFRIKAENYAPNNKYIQSATLNGQEWNKPWFSHDDIRNGGELVLRMGHKANQVWGSAPGCEPPSAEPLL